MIFIQPKKYKNNGFLGGGAIGLIRKYVAKNGLNLVTREIAKAVGKFVSVRVANRVAGLAAGAAFIYAIGTWSLFG